jgi:hypothetical protein
MLQFDPSSTFVSIFSVGVIDTWQSANVNGAPRYKHILTARDSRHTDLEAMDGDRL